jgi:hypothetical protein
VKLNNKKYGAQPSASFNGENGSASNISWQ